MAFVQSSSNFTLVTDQTRLDLQVLTIFSPHLGGRADVTVCPSSNPNAPILILLHGVYGSHWNWSHYGLAEAPPFHLVMPSDGLANYGSLYAAHGGKDYGAWIAEDLVSTIRSYYGWASQLFLAGNSMGGWGTLRLASLWPQWTAVAALSSVTHLSTFRNYLQDFSSISVEEPDLAKLLINAKKLPPLWLGCGTDDELYADNLRLHNKLVKHEVEHVWVPSAGGHNWQYWKSSLQQAIEFFSKHLTPLPDLSSEFEAFLSVCEGGEAPKVGELLQQRPHWLNQKSTDGWSALITAAKTGRFEVVELLLGKHCRVNPTPTELANAEKEGAKPLHTPLRGAALYGHLEVCKLLLDNGADPNIASSGKRTPMMGAAMNGHKEVVRLLLNYGALPAARNLQGESALDLAEATGRTDICSLFFQSK